jgi:hypothetical protein
VVIGGCETTTVEIIPSPRRSESKRMLSEFGGRDGGASVAGSTGTFLDDRGDCGIRRVRG